jgi:hypothetical protein
MRDARARFTAAAIAVLFIWSCGRQTPPPPAAAPPPPPPPVAAGISVSSVELGTAIDANKRVTAPVEVFKPQDVVYASVTTTGSAPSATLVARFTYEDGQVVEEFTQQLGGAGVTEFHMSKPDGWPTGTYRLDVMLDGANAATRTFTVK